MMCRSGVRNVFDQSDPKCFPTSVIDDFVATSGGPEWSRLKIVSCATLIN